jgi:tetratricopeptide (TPR) repeat protein
LDAALNDTLTYDFENVSPATPTASAAMAVAAASGSAGRASAPGAGTAAGASLPAASSATSGASALAPVSPATAARDSRATATNTSDSEAKPLDWTPDGRDRRSSPERRGRRKEDWAPETQVPREAINGGASSGHSPKGTERPARRSGADALARIDAALERAAADAAAHPKPTNPTPITPAEAAAIVAAARAAGSQPVKHQPAPRQQTSERAATASDHAAPAAERTTASAPERVGKAFERAIAPGRRSEPAEITTPASARATPANPLPAPAASQAQAPTSARVASAAPDADQHLGVAQHPGAGQPTFGHSTLTVGTYPDPTSILTRDTVRARGGPMDVNWGEVTMDGLPKVARLQPIRPRRWPWVVFGLVAGAAAAIYFWLPRFDTQTLPPEVAAVVDPVKSAITSVSPATPHSPVATASAASDASVASGASGASSATAEVPTAQVAAIPAASTSSPPTAAADEQRLRQMRQSFDNRLASLEARGAGVWGGHEFAMAKTRAAESVGARDAGNPRVAEERLAAAMKLLDTVESKAPQALSAQVAAGEQALGAGQQEVAGQAFDLARRINPSDRRASDGLRRTQNLPAVLPLLADAQNAEAAHDYARAAQDYSQALSLDPGNATAKAGQARSNAAFGDDNYAKAVGAGFAALGAGRLDEAHEAFVKARALKPNGAEASEGLRRVGAALTARGFASMRQRATGLEAQERWDEAQQTYEDVLSADSSLAFAQEGRARATSRADLSIRLQQLIDRPDRLSSPGVREDARALLETARAQSPQGPVIRSQIARLEVLLPSFDKPVRLSLVSDNSTQVAISSIGAFGTFSRRDIELRPGKYTVVGTRNGFRDVRREITVAPGQDAQTIRVTCSEPI